MTVDDGARGGEVEEGARGPGKTSAERDDGTVELDAPNSSTRKRFVDLARRAPTATTIGLVSLGATVLALLVSILAFFLPANSEASEAEIHPQVYLDSAPFGSPNVGDRLIELDGTDQPMAISAADVDKYAVTLQVRVDNTGGSSIMLRNFAVEILDGYTYAAKDANAYSTNQVDAVYCERSYSDRTPCSGRLPEVLESRESVTISMNLDQWFSPRAASNLGRQPLMYTLDVEGEGTEPTKGAIPVTFVP